MTDLCKWLKKLTDAELVAMHKRAVYKHIRNRVERCGEYLTFYEYFVPSRGEKGHYIPTVYEMTDYGYEGSHDVTIDDESTAKMQKFMAKRFGKPYLEDLLWYKTGIAPSFFRTVMEDGRKCK